MSEINDGGPAFPRLESADTNRYDDPTWRFTSVGGMSLRDWFAGQALAGICGDGIPGGHHIPPKTAADAYAYADEMLKAREPKS